MAAYSGLFPALEPQNTQMELSFGCVMIWSVLVRPDGVAFQKKPGCRDSLKICTFVFLLFTRMTAFHAFRKLSNIPG